MIYLLRFGVIVLGTILVALLLFMTAAYSSRNKTFSASTWTSDVILAIMIVAGMLGAGFGYIDSTLFDPVTAIVIVPSSGIMLAGDIEVGVYWDVTGTSVVTMVEWGELEPGGVGTVQFWVKNEGNTLLYCVTGTFAWEPSGSEQYFDLTWNFGETPVGPGRSRKVTMELHVHEDITGVEEFSFDVIIYGDAVPLTS